jgi:predicted alpha/beta hydrolase family esterase
MAVLIFPGLGGSGEGHWQRHWASELPDARLVEQSDWSRPVLSEWLDKAIAAIAANPGAVLVGHSLGAVLIAHLGSLRPDLPIRGALLVAPADVDETSPSLTRARGFGPLPTTSLPFLSIVVASRNDPYMRFDRARVLSRLWDAALVDLGNAGHINIDSGHGRWLEGRLLIDRVAGRATRPFLIAGRTDETAAPTKKPSYARR